MQQCQMIIRGGLLDVLVNMQMKINFGFKIIAVFLRVRSSSKNFRAQSLTCLHLNNQMFLPLDVVTNFIGFCLNFLSCSFHFDRFDKTTTTTTSKIYNTTHYTKQTNKKNFFLQIFISILLQHET